MIPWNRTLGLVSTCRLRHRIGKKYDFVDLFPSLYLSGSFGLSSVDESDSNVALAENGPGMVKVLEVLSALEAKTEDVVKPLKVRAIISLIESRSRQASPDASPRTQRNCTSSSVTTSPSPCRIIDHPPNDPQKVTADTASSPALKLLQSGIQDSAVSLSDVGIFTEEQYSEGSSPVLDRTPSAASLSSVHELSCARESSSSLDTLANSVSDATSSLSVESSIVSVSLPSDVDSLSEPALSLHGSVLSLKSNEEEDTFPVPYGTAKQSSVLQNDNTDLDNAMDEPSPVCEVFPLASCVPPPPPPPPMPGTAKALVFRNCPLILGACHPDSIFAEMEMWSPTDFEHHIDANDFRKHFGILAPTPVASVGADRRDSGLADVGESGATLKKHVSVLDDRRAHTLGKPNQPKRILLTSLLISFSPRTSAGQTPH